MIDGFHNMVSRAHLYSSDEGEQKMCHDQLDPSGTLLDSSLVDKKKRERLLSVLSSH